MPNRQLINYLDEHHIKYDMIQHDAAFTAQETAAAAHVPGKELAKTVIVKMDNQLAMVLMPAHVYINMQMLKDLTGVKDVDLATEADFRESFPECELGAMPPFGNLYNLDVYASRRLEDDKEIVFNAGNHSELIRLSWGDFLKLVNPKLLDL